MSNNKIGRNDPCYCGSGQKYKKCCMGIYKTAESSLSDSEIKRLADHIQEKCIKEHGDNENAAKQFWKDLVTAVYDKDPAAVPVMIEAQPDKSNKEYMHMIYKELQCLND